jgi:hypothetical protein
MPFHTIIVGGLDRPRAAAASLVAGRWIRDERLCEWVARNVSRNVLAALLALLAAPIAVCGLRTVQPRNGKSPPVEGFSEAGDGGRTRDLRLGKPTLCQLSYTRADRRG